MRFSFAFSSERLRCFMLVGLRFICGSDFAFSNLGGGKGLGWWEIDDVMIA
jgi:hypothetical protein